MVVGGSGVSAEGFCVLGVGVQGFCVGGVARVWGLGEFEGSGFRVQGLGFRVQGLGFRV